LAAGGALVFGRAAGLAFADAVACGCAASTFGATVVATVGAGVCGRAVGGAVGAGGSAVGFAVGADVGTGLGAALGGILTLTATATAVGSEVGTAGSSVLGFGSKTAVVGTGFGWAVACGRGDAWGGALGAIFVSSRCWGGTGWRAAATGRGCATGATRGACGNGAACRTGTCTAATTGARDSSVTIEPPALLSVAPSCDEFETTEKSSAASNTCASSDAR